MRKIISLIKGELFRIIFGALVFAAAVLLERLEFDVAAICTFAAALVIAGAEVFFDAVRGILRRDFLDEKFLMSIASVGAMIIGEYTEGVAVMLFFLVGEYFEHRAVRRSRQSIKSLLEICPDEATVLTDGGEETVDAEDVEVGSVIVIRPGERVPLDCVVLEGYSEVDTSAMTGESQPRSVKPGDTLESGVVLINGALKCQTLKVAAESAASRVLALVENASERKSREETFITKFSRFYTPAVVAAAVLIAVLMPLLRLNTVSEAIYKALMFLVISCPCALVISVPMAFFGGIGCAASKGILFKGGNVFSAIARAETVAFDKTGTLTTGKFAVGGVETFGCDENEVLRVAASAEYDSNHPIAQGIRASSTDARCPESTEEIAGKGVVAYIDGARVAVGNLALMKDETGTSPTARDGSVYVAKDGALIGIIEITDSVKSEAGECIKRLNSLGVKRTVMLTGDRREKAEAVASELGIKEVHAELMPDEKYAELEGIISESTHTVYVGDGINDAPALAVADVGVAMGALGQDSAIEAADAVIMSDNLLNLPEMVKIARKTLRIAKQNIVFAIGVKLAVMLLGVLGFANMWLAVIADVGVAVLAILNAMRTLIKGK